jgi:hypothetical protein
MRLSCRARAARFADEWRDARNEKGETHSFYNDLFDVFGVKRRRVASFEEPVKLLGHLHVGTCRLPRVAVVPAEKRPFG